MSRIPAAPSVSVPERMTPITRLPPSRAAVWKSGSTAGRRRPRFASPNLRQIL
jgi:hypothetical protein